MKTSPLDAAALHFSRLGPAGLSPAAPGTCGSALAALLAVWLFLPLPLPYRIGLLCLLFFVAGPAATRAEMVLGQKDPGSVVSDELIGQWTTYLPFASLSVYGIAAGFVLFRIFDIAKPWPVRSSEKWLPAGFGVMIDDVIAGLYAMLCLYGLRLLFPSL